MLKLIYRFFTYLSAIVFGIYIFRNEIVELAINYLTRQSKEHSYIRIDSPYINLYPPEVEVKRIDIIHNNEIIFQVENAKIAMGWPFSQNNIIYINEISGIIRKWQIVRESSGRSNIDVLSDWAENCPFDLSIKSLKITVRNVSFLDYVFSEAGLCRRQPSENVQSVSLDSVEGDPLTLLSWALNKILFEVPFSIEKLSKAKPLLKHQATRTPYVRLYTERPSQPLTD
ncbi:MAG: hypothetical protein NZM04_03120 [Methylacidiphilales bacterium]|nr:hypothetical protein [Candidatus Methylacidiphilales bacterium]MDW8348724.1 hypothetical protein [Verrucomicrobiae bacterium]